MFRAICYTILCLPAAADVVFMTLESCNEDYRRCLYLSSTDGLGKDPQDACTLDCDIHYRCSETCGTTKLQTGTLARTLEFETAKKTSSATILQRELERAVLYHQAGDLDRAAAMYVNLLQVRAGAGAVLVQSCCT